MNDVLNDKVKDALTQLRNMKNIFDEYTMTEESLMKNNKKPLADCLAEIAVALSVGKVFLTEGISHMMRSKISLQKQLIEIQVELVKRKTEQLQSV